MPKPKPERVSITIQPVAGDEQDTFEVAFLGADGSRAQGTELTLPAGKVGTWEITCTVAEPVATGGGFLFQRHTFLFSHRIQDYNPRGRDYVTMQSHTDADVRLIVNSLRQSHQPGFAQVVVDGGELKPGDTFTIRVGDRSGGGAGSEVYDGATLGRILGAVDRDGSGTYRELGCNPATILITSEPVPRLLRVLGPSIVPPGEPFHLNLIVFDPNHNVCEQYRGEVELTAADAAVEGLPSSVRFGPDEGGLVVLEGVRIDEPGLYRITATDSSNELSAMSNPILCQGDLDRRLLWGNLHCHGTGDINMALMDDLNFKIHPARRHEQLRRVGREDFGAVGPAVPPNLEDRPELWQIYQQVCRDNDEPGTYVPFLAAETHPRPGGDRNVVFREMTEYG
jgi:hypothetical protein